MSAHVCGRYEPADYIYRGGVILTITVSLVEILSTHLFVRILSTLLG